MEKWLRKEIEAERKTRKERREAGLPEFENPLVDGTRVVGDPASKAAQPLNNGWAGGRLASTMAGEKAFDFSSNRVLRQ